MKKIQVIYKKDGSIKSGVITCFANKDGVEMEMLKKQVGRSDIISWKTI